MYHVGNMLESDKLRIQPFCVWLCTCYIELLEVDESKKKNEMSLLQFFAKTSEVSPDIS